MANTAVLVLFSRVSLNYFLISLVYLDVDENFVWAGLLHGDLLVLDGSTGLLNYHGPLLRRDGGCHVCGWG